MRQHGYFLPQFNIKAKLLMKSRVCSSLSTCCEVRMDVVRAQYVI